jgi:hypothetical protein
MTIRALAPTKRTIVPFLTLTLGALIATGCSAVGPRTASTVPCPPARRLVCENFGPESRCQCSDAAAIDREIARLGRSARAGWLGW